MSRTAPALLPWPRAAEDGTALGIDLAAKARDVRLLTLAELGRRSRRAPVPVEVDELVQEVYAAITRKNRQPCAWDPRRGSLGTYVTRVARCTISNLDTAHDRWCRIIPPKTGAWRSDVEVDPEADPPEIQPEAVDFTTPESLALDAERERGVTLVDRALAARRLFADRWPSWMARAARASSSAEAE